MTYSIGDKVLYGSQGVCLVDDITQKEFNGNTTEYYILKPVSDEKSTIYVPVDNEAATAVMRPIVSVEDIYSLIKAMPDNETIWIDDDTRRRERYKAILTKGDRTELLKLIKTLYMHEQQLREKGKKVHVADQRFLSDAEKLLHVEFAHVLNINQDQVLPFIMEQMEREEEETAPHV